MSSYVFYVFWEYPKCLEQSKDVLITLKCAENLPWCLEHKSVIAKIVIWTEQHAYMTFGIFIGLANAEIKIIINWLVDNVKKQFFAK